MAYLTALVLGLFVAYMGGWFFGVALAYQFTPTWGGQVLLGGSFLMFMINMRIP